MLADEPEKNWTWMLPLHFCSVMQVVCALSLWIPSRRLRSVAYYCVLCATLQGLVTPSVAHDFPSWTYFAFFLSHGVTVIMEAGALGFPVGFFAGECVPGGHSSRQHASGNQLRVYRGHSRRRVRAGLSRAMALVPAVDAGSGAGADVSAHAPLPPLSQGPHGQFPVPPLKGNLSSPPRRFRRNPRKTARPFPEKKSPGKFFIV